ncbi:MAG: Sec-dependent nitrous-oxide reductase [Gemmatimonadetes bacterium]|nr:Sec-dependent nitrous-oxide reductase [Gemmatimonadota bacterium]
MPRKSWTRPMGRLLTGAIAAAVLAGCGGSGGGTAGASVQELMQARNLSEADVVAALKTYTPTGRTDPFVMFASGGHSGQVIVIGIPSMRILKYIGVFTPEPWQGYGFDDQTKALMASSSPRGKDLTWGDSHHPALSETNGDYDGQFLFINDKANARIAVVSLKDFVTTQIVHSPILGTDHGGSFVTPNTDYIIEGGQYPVPLDGSYQPITDFDDKYRGAVMFWKFDRDNGAIDPSQSFAMELPPYMQDLSDAGKLVSDGWAFINSFDTERSHGGDMEGQPPLESGASQNDMDYLHVIDWKKAAEVAAQAGKTRNVQGVRVIPLATAVQEGLLYFVPEPKSPHGVDVTPDGRYLAVSGKLDTHETVYDWSKIKAAIDVKNFEGNDPYGVPIIGFQTALHGQVELGLGPLHTQWDDQGNGYTSLFIESKIAKWSLKDMKVLEKIPVHYNIGHLATPEGDSEHPKGHYVVALDKWSIDRFNNVGPLMPQNMQLIDTSTPQMQLLYDLPIGLGEPHYAQIISADKLNAAQMYSPVGENQVTHQPDPHAITSEDQARVERHGRVVDVYMTAVRSHFKPDRVDVTKGDTVHFHITNLEQTPDATHGFGLGEYDVNLSLEAGKTANVTVVTDKAGVFPYYCTEFCSALHLEMMGYMLVKG